MRKRLKIGLVALVMAILLGVLFVVFRPNEPSYAGRTLSAWLADIGANTITNPDQRIPSLDTQRRGANAVSAIGTNACPCLLNWMRYRPPWWKRVIIPAVNYVVTPFFPRSRLWDKRELQGLRAGLAFQHLPRVDDSVIHALIRLKDDPDWGVALRAKCALSGQAKVSFLALLTVLEDPFPNQVAYVWNFRTNANAAIPPLIKCLSATNVMVALAAANMLGKLQLEPALVIPALTKATQDPRPSLRAQVIPALTEFGRTAPNALPVLRQAVGECLKDPDVQVRRQATNTLRKLDMLLN